MARPTLEELEKAFPNALKEFVQVHRYQQSDFDGRQFLDIGSNIGFVSLLALAWGAKRVIAVEPDHTNFIELRKNLGPYPEAMLLECATHGFATRVSIADVGSNCKTIPAAEGSVAAYPLETLVKLFDPGDDNLVMKIDAEGAEFDILLNASSAAIRPFATIMLESHQVPHLQQHPARKAGFLKTYLDYMGYKILNEEPLLWYANDGTISNIENMVALRMQRTDRP